METERIKLCATPVDYGIHQVATEHAKLLTQSYDYGSCEVFAKHSKSKECIVQMPKHSAESLFRIRTALSLEELLLYQGDPFWKCIRRTLMISFWLALIAIFTTACIIVFLEDKQHCGTNPTESTAETISAIDAVAGVFRGNLSSASTLLVDSTTKKFFNKSSIE